MVMNNLDGTTKTEMSFGTKNKTVHATIKFDDDSFKVLNKDGSLASLHAAQGTDSDSAVTLGYFESEITRLERQANKITSSNDDNMIHYNEDSGTLGINNVTADRITGLTPNKVLITDEDGIITASGIGKTQLRKLNNLPDDAQTELDGKADKDHTHKIADVEGLQDELDSKALVEHTHKATDIDGFDGVTVHSAEYADEAEKAKMDINGTPIANYVRNVTVDNNKITITKGNGDVTVSEYIKEVVPATEDADGEAGLVPAPCRADEGKFLSALGTWEKPKAELADTGITVPAEDINSWPKRIDDLEVAAKELIGEVYPLKDSVEAVQQSVEDLNTELAGKADAEHTHEVSDINGLRDSLDSMTAQIQENGSDLEQVAAEMDTKAPMNHTHTIDNVTDLQTALDEKAAVDHEHEIADITDLADALASKAEATHTHEMDEVTGLTDVLDAKAEVEHTHAIEDVTGLQDTLDEKAMADHDHTISQISDIADASVAEAVKAKQDINGKALTDYVTSITADGANLKVSKGDGTFTNVTLSTEGSYSEFEGATESEAGTFGLVPAPQAGDQNKVLSGAGTWVDAPTPDLGDAGITASAEELNYMTGVIANVQTQLDEKAAAVHTHTAADITDFAESAKTAVATELEAKADVDHTHEMDDVNGLADALGGKAASEHTHTMEDITDLDLATAEVAKATEATKATTDKNDKDITEYVSDVTQEDSKIKVTKGDGTSTEITIDIPEPETYEIFTGASDAAAGEAGLVPAPAIGDQEKFLKADGTWATPVDTNTEYDIATAETAGLVKPSSEISVAAETGEMTVVAIPQSKVTGLENKFVTMSQAANKFEVTGGTFEDTRVMYSDSEIRVMYPETTSWDSEIATLADDENTRYMTLRAYAPEGATGYRAAAAESIESGAVTPFGEPDTYGRYYIESKLPVAVYSQEDSAWTYLGDESETGKLAGWFYTIEWYNASNKVIDSTTIRINLATEANYNQYLPNYMADYAKTADVSAALEGKADTEHTHNVADITDLDLSAAEVAKAAEATKATQDANGKAITEYVADVTLQDSTIHITKGDGTDSQITLPEGTAYADFTGTDGSAAGTAGLVPAPQTTDADKFLKSDGTWATVEASSVTTPVATEETAGIVKASSEIAVAPDGAMSITVVEQSKVTGLTDALAGKANATHTHEIASVTGLQDALDGKVDSDDLTTELAKKADTTHTHAIADVTDLQTTLDGKAAATHTHTVADITDLDLENAEVGRADSAATADKAVTDSNGKAITDYVAEVSFADSKLTITKGDDSTEDIELPEGTVYSNFTGATAEAAGAAGLVPAPAMGDQDKYLKADGTWGAITIPEPEEVPIASADAAGIVKPSAEIAVTAETGEMSIVSVSSDKVTGLDTALAGKADAEHSHTVEDLTDLTVTAEQINGLPAAVAAKAEAEHTHTVSDITDLDLSTAEVAKADEASKVTNAMSVTINSDPESTVTFDGSAAQTVDITLAKLGAAAESHTHEVGDVTGLADTLLGKAEAEHTHAIDDVTDLATTLAGKAAVDHDHTIEDITNLQTSLDAKLDADDLVAASTETAGIVKLSSEVGVDDSGALKIHAVDSSKVTGLTEALAGKAATEHTHTMEDITDLDLANASVASATKATQDANGKAITDYVASVTAEDSKITVTKGDGSSNEITLPEGTVYGNFTGTDGVDAGSAGLVPAPTATDTNKYLKSDGTWAAVETSEVTVPVATEETAGIVKPSTEIAVADDGVMSVVSIEQSKVNGLTDALAGKANATHTHEIAGVTGLQDALDAKLNATALTVATNEATGVVKGSTEINVGKDGALTVTSIAQSKVSGLDTALTGKADAEHTHTVSDITDLDLSAAKVAEAGKVTNAFTVTLNGGLEEGETVTFDGSSEQTIDISLDTIGAASASHTHATSEVDGLDNALAGKASSVHTHQTSEVTGLDDALAGKAAATHSHAISEITDLQTTLDGKAASTHSHTIANISDIGDAVVAEATKATTDKNSKDITEYVSGVSLSGHTITVTKGDASSEQIELPEGTVYGNFGGASAEAEGTAGLVPAPVMGDQDKYLKADGTWNAISIPEPEEVPVATAETAGIVKASDEIGVDGTGTLSITAVAQEKVTGLDTALAAKANATHDHTISQISDIANASVASATKATQDANGKAITDYVTGISYAENKLTVTKGDTTTSEVELPAGTTYGIASSDAAGLVKPSTEISVAAETGEMTVTAIEQSKVTGLTDALSGKAAATHTHTMSDVTDLNLANASVLKATQDANGNAITSYLNGASISGNKLTLTKGDSTNVEIDLPAGGGTSDVFEGTDGDSAGVAGLVPAPTAEDSGKFLSADGSWKIIEGSGQILYTSDVPTTATVGGIPAGYTPPSAGIDILDLIYKLLHPYVAPTLTATMLPRNGGTVGIDTTQNITGVRVNLQSTGGNKIMSYQVYDVDSDFDSQVALGELWAEDYENGFATGAQNVNLSSPYQMTASSNHKYLTVRVTDLDGNVTIIKTASFQFVETYYWGSAPEGTVINEDYVLGDDTKSSAAKAKGSTTVSVDHSDGNKFVWFAAPKSYGEITSIKDENNFENIDAFTLGGKKTEISINGRDYYVYHNDAFGGTMTFVFSY